MKPGNLNIVRFMELATEVGDLGWAVKEQMEAVLRGEDLEDRNLNALEMVLDVLRDLADAEIADADFWVEKIEDYLQGLHEAAGGDELRA